MISHTVSALNAHVISFDTVVVLLTWLSAVIGAAITFCSRGGGGRPRSWRGFLAFLVPPPIWRHRSPRMDVLYYVIQHAMLPILAVPFMLSNVAVAVWVYQRLSNIFGVHQQISASLPLWIVLLAITLVVTDFASWLQHFLFHKIRPFWEFHKAHHSAEFLTPLSNRRIHPFDEVADIFGQAICVGVTTGVLSYALSLPIYESSIIGLDVYFVGNLLSFYHLRHSHIDMAYGPRLEKWLMSPAQHQLHHSREEEHWDCNFGQLLSVWDSIFGTLQHSKPYGTFRLGLPEAEAVGYDTLVGLYLTPVLNNVRRVWPNAPLLGRRVRAIEPAGSGTPVPEGAD